MSEANILKIFACNGNPELSQAICDHMQIPLGDAKLERFADGEIKVIINEDVRGNDIFVVQSTCPPVNRNLMELLIMIDALKRASAKRITAVIPYFGYARQDRKHDGRTPITAKLVANMITTAGANRVLAMDLHATQIQGFFDIPVDHLLSAPVFINEIKKMNIEDLTIMTPDIGSSKMGGSFASHLKCDLAIGDKRRQSDTDVTVERIIGNVKGRNIVMIDDMISTAGTITDASRMALEQGAKSVRLMAVHPVFCGPALERLNAINIKEMIVTNSITVSDDFKTQCNPKLTTVNVGPLLGEAIRRIHNDQSVSALFKLNK